ncbi:MAG: cytochrome b/b6 domain-containing protein [Anaerolineae bacterium]|nr:cytochrome b/b6 domain-containing protein [Anaerolineae bacterium]
MKSIFKRLFIFALILIGAGLVLVAMQGAAAQEPIPMHPTYALLDADGNHVLESSKPVSTLKTCGQCHDTEYIEQHSGHTQVGLDQLIAGETPSNRRDWELTSAYFGEWDPLLYRTLTATGDTSIDLTTPDWIKLYGVRHVGGGPAMYSRAGGLLTDLPADELTPENATVDPTTGELVVWDWAQSGMEEMNCFLCHTATPDNTARTVALQSGEFGWANTATLNGTGIVSEQDGEWVWNADAFDVDGKLLAEYVTVQDPRSDNCGQCHGTVHGENQVPLTGLTCDASQNNTTLRTGQVFSSQLISKSGLNLSNKSDLNRSWDIHAERVVECTDCHYAMNNPVYYKEAASDSPEHLVFDPRRLDISEYLRRPLHDFANGQPETDAAGIAYQNVIQPCEACHDTEVSHEWLPYEERHMDVLACETCHVPKMYAPALQTVDWTVIQPDSSPVLTCRGMDTSSSGNQIINGFEPVLLPHANPDGSTILSPYNLVTTWLWVYGDPAQPVPLVDLQAAWLDGENYAADVLAVFDANSDGTVTDAELMIDSDAKEALITERLATRGLENPRIEGDVQPYSINHGVAGGDWVTKDCDSCHTDDSRVNTAMILSDYTPGSTTPTFHESDGAKFSGDFVEEDGKLFYQPQTNTDVTDLYIFGHNRAGWVDWLGLAMFLGVFAGVLTHSGLRYRAARKMAGQHKHSAELHKVYMYSLYERQWHWLQTAVIFTLIFTGLVIHKPDQFGMFSFRYVVQIHNLMAIILLINAALAAFYHFASGQIRQFLPRPYGFFDQAFAQAKFYLSGIFKGEPHPMEKTPEQKMNPLQQLTYLGLLNVLLPLQILTGAMMWGIQRFPELADDLGGLPFLAPIHTLVAWMFATFIVMHVYLTTTGHHPLAGIKGMMMGWDEVETHDQTQTNTPEAQTSAAD